MNRSCDWGWRSPQKAKLRSSNTVVIGVVPQLGSRMKPFTGRYTPLTKTYPRRASCALFILSNLSISLILSSTSTSPLFASSNSLLYFLATPTALLRPPQRCVHSVSSSVLYALSASRSSPSVLIVVVRSLIPVEDTASTSFR